MNIVGADYLTSSIDAGGYFIKAILNERGIHFIPHAVEHLDASLPGISYKDDSQGHHWLRRSSQAEWISERTKISR